MKRGKALIIALVILLVVSVLSTGNYISFADNLSGGAYSTVGNAIAIVTGNLVATTPGISMQAAQISVATKIHGESCQSATSCLSSTCIGSPKKCKDDSWRTIPSGFKTGRVCRFDSQCVSGKCLKTFITVNGLALGLCGKDVGNRCSLNADCLSGKCTGSPKKCVKSFSGGLCLNDADCSTNLKCTSNRCKPAQAQLKANGEECTALSDCDTGACSPVGDKKYCGYPLAVPCQASVQCATLWCTNINPITKRGICFQKGNNAACTKDPECSSTFCDPATNKCAALVLAGESITAQEYPDAGAIEAYDSNSHRVKLKTAIENAINMLKTRLNSIEALHQNQAAGAMVAITGAAGVDNPRIAGEHCTGPSDCISNNCRLDSGSNQKVCYDPKPTSSRIGIRQVGAACNNEDVCVTGYCPGTQLQSKTCKKRPNGLTCDKNTQCTSGKCSNGICGKQRGEECGSDSSLCLSGECFSGQCDYSNPTSTNPNDLCGVDNDCNRNNKCSNFHRCTTVASLKNYNTACTFNENCLSGTCTNIKCAKSTSGELCETHVDCENNKCENNRCKLVMTTPGIPMQAAPIHLANGATCSSDAICSSNYCNPSTHKCAVEMTTPGIAMQAAPAQYPDAGAGEAYSGPQTLSDWKAILTTLSTAMQGVEDRICTESFKHPEIETEGLPCSFTSPLTTNIQKTKSIFSTLFRTSSPRVGIP